jgi:hypothetical protein
MENSELKEIFRRAMDVKALSHLNNARKYVQHELNRELEELSSVDYDKYIKSEIRNELANKLVYDVENQIKVSRKEHTGNKLYELDLIVLPTEMFQYVINTIVKNMSQENLDKIRKQ